MLSSTFHSPIFTDFLLVYTQYSSHIDTNFFCNLSPTCSSHIVTNFLPVCTLSPTCSSDIITDLPFFKNSCS